MFNMAMSLVLNFVVLMQPLAEQPIGADQLFYDCRCVAGPFYNAVATDQVKKRDSRGTGPYLPWPDYMYWEAVVTACEEETGLPRYAPE